MHIYDQDRPFFFFWNRKGVVKVKQLFSDLMFAPLETNMKVLREPNDAEEIWTVTQMLQF